MPTVVCEDKCM